MAHEKIKGMMGAVFRQARFSTNIEPPNIFHGKAPRECLDCYLNLHTTREAIIPDFLIHDFLGDANGSKARNMAAIFDFKTLRIDTNSLLYAVKKTGEARRATDMKFLRVGRDYPRRPEKLDVTCAEGNATHPFTEVMKNNCHSSGVHPLVFGKFGDVNGATSRLITAALASQPHDRRTPTSHH